MNEWQEINTQDLQAMHAQNQNLVIIDNRDPESYNLQHIPDAINIPLSQLPVQYSQLAKQEPVVCYCYRGESSKLAAQMLIEHGFNQVYSLIGGFNAWSSAQQGA